jgi:hypothetical protein
LAKKESNIVNEDLAYVKNQRLSTEIRKRAKGENQRLSTEIKKRAKGVVEKAN